MRYKHNKPSSFMRAIFLKNITNSETAVLQRGDITGK
jgi:hypothetical protein